MANSRKARVLAIDDEATMLEWLKTLLEQEGYEVRTSLSAHAARSCSAPGGPTSSSPT